MKYSLCAVILMAGFWVTSCNSGVEIERISPENLVALSSFISPQDSIVRVYVYQGKALGDISRSETAVISDAKVTIEEEGKIHTLGFESKTNSYEISNQILKVTPSKHYTLQVTTKSGLVLKAACTVPSNPDTLLFESVKEGNDFVFSPVWPEKTSFFTFSFELKNVIFNPKLGATTGPYLGVVTGNNLYESADRPNKLLENKVYNAFLAETISLKITLYSLDKNAFNYMKTKVEAYNWSANTSGLIPNLREPQPVYSNVQGGVGIFGSYNQSINVIIIK
ncbi:DUF4249 domain-containing protein [Runella sp.]|uniref:DUF4249 domain-containing protein n=1 Tax=Runella sp. TaxID=1960881 RepID=UPI003D113DFA